jgi:IS5 family transposase
MSWVHRYLKPLLVWFSDKVYADLIRRAEDQLLVKLDGKLDFGPLEKACAGYHHATGPGCKPTHTVACLVRALLVGYLFNWSGRQLEFQIRYNLVVKWFVGYGVFDAGPDHTTLHRFEQWVCEHQHRSYFDSVLRQIDADFPEEREQPQIGDTYALQANAAKESLVRLIRHTCQRMLRDLAAVHPLAHQRVIEELDHLALFGAADEPSYYRLDSAGRKKQLQTTVVAALRCAELVSGQLTDNATLSVGERQKVVDWLDRLDKIMADEVRIERDAESQVIEVSRLAKDKRGSYRMGSATDPEVTYRVHGKNKVDLGYNVSVAVTTNFVREIQADTGAQPDAVAVPDLLTAQMEHHDVCPPKLIYDTAAGQGKTRAEVQKATQGQTQLVAPLMSNNQQTKRFTPDDFTLSDEGLALTCPNGQTTFTLYRSGEGEAWTFRFPSSMCHGCPLWTDCRDPKASPEGPRQVFISDHRSLLDAARAYSQTDDFKADMKLRPHVERIIAAITRHNGGRRARRRGQRKADFQAKMNATACNIKRWLRLLSVAQAAPASANV